MKSVSFRSKTFRYLLIVGFGSLLLSGCGPRKQTELEFAPQMYRSPALKAQEYDGTSSNLSVMRKPPEGTVPINFTPYHLTLADSFLQEKISNPRPKTDEIIAEGKKHYNIYCIVCHGETGDGNGLIVQKGMVKPPSFIDGQTKNWSDGRIFHIITRGRGNMSGYAAQVKPETRWSIIHYIRELQKSANAIVQSTNSSETKKQ